MTFNVVFLDFDKTIFDIKIPDYEVKRDLMRSELKQRYGVTSNLKPILEETHKLEEYHPGIRKFIFDKLTSMEMNSEVDIYPYTKSLLKKYSDSPVAIISNNCEAVIKRELKKSHLDNFVNVIISRDDQVDAKPSPEPLQAAWKLLLEQEIVESDALKTFLMIGDCWRDKESAAVFAQIQNCNYVFVTPDGISNLLNEI